MTCEVVRAALSMFDVCVETEEGSRVTTHCLYPSFEPVNVYVVKFGEGYRVHDGGGALRVAWVHGRDHPLIKKMLARQAARFSVRVSESGDSLVANARSIDWLPSAILAVANASASAAHLALERVVAATEAVLEDRIYETLVRTVPLASIAKGYEMPGKSGKLHSFDFAVKEPRWTLILLDAVVPHHISVAAKYVAFADLATEEPVDKFAVHDRDLDESDISLLQQVADIVAFRKLDRGLQRAMTHVRHQ